jgi:hypothetical protein
MWITVTVSRKARTSPYSKEKFSLQYLHGGEGIAASNQLPAKHRCGLVQDAVFRDDLQTMADYSFIDTLTFPGARGFSGRNAVATSLRRISAKVLVRDSRDCMPRVIYGFTDGEITASSDSITADILAAIQRSNAGLRLYVSTGIFSTEYHSEERRTVYRLRSDRHGAYIDFELVKCKKGFECHTLMLFVQPEFQGNFFNVRDFLINRVAKTLFSMSHRVCEIWGRAIINQFPTRGKEWRNRMTSDGKTTRLIRFYELLGFKQEGEGSVVMTLFPPSL